MLKLSSLEMFEIAAMSLLILLSAHTLLTNTLAPVYAAICWVVISVHLVLWVISKIMYRDEFED